LVARSPPQPTRSVEAEADGRIMVAEEESTSAPSRKAERDGEAEGM